MDAKSYGKTNGKERVHLNFMGPFPTSKGGNKHILVMVDSFSKWTECIALEPQSAELTAKTAIKGRQCYNCTSRVINI